MLGLNVLHASLVTQSSLSLCNPMDCSLTGSSVHGVLQAILEYCWSNTGVGCHFLLQGVFPNQGLNPCLQHLLHCKWILYL